MAGSYSITSQDKPTRVNLVIRLSVSV